MEVIYRDPNALKPYERNAKRHPDSQITRIAESINQFGFRQPVVIDSENHIVAGHGRVLAALQLGLDKIPCILVDDLTPTQIKAYRLADNKTAESDWDFNLLNVELGGIPDIDMTVFGFTELPDIDIDDFFSEIEEGPEKEEKEIKCPHCGMSFKP